MIESAYLKKLVICSDYLAVQKNSLEKIEEVFLFSSNSIISLNNSIKSFSRLNKGNLKEKVLYAKKKSKIYTIENHSK